MKGPARVNIDDVRRDLESPNVETRGRALNAMLNALNRQPELHQPAREIFRASAEGETNNWLATTSVAGIERLDGPDAARPYWLRLITQPDAVAAGQAAMSIYHPSHLPMMLQQIDARPDFLFLRGAIYSIGRMRDPSAIPRLMQWSDDEAMQPRLVQAFGDIGDPSAIPWLQSLVPSNRHLPDLDERGAQWTLGDIAAQAIRQIESAIKRRYSPPPLPAAGMPAMRSQQPLRRKLPLPHPSLIPLLCAGAEVLWLMFLFAFYLFMVGDQRPTFTISNRFADGLALPLPIIGFAAAVTLLIARRTPRPWHKIVAILGGLLCGLFILSFGSEFITG